MQRERADIQRVAAGGSGSAAVAQSFRDLSLTAKVTATAAWSEWCRCCAGSGIPVIQTSLCFTRHSGSPAEVHPVRGRTL